MPNRLSLNTRLFAYRYLVLRDGEECCFCHRNGHLEIDHINGNPHDHDPSNLRLLCKSCNVKMRRLDENLRRELFNHVDSARLRERARGETSLVKRAASYAEGSPEMQVCNLCEGRFRQWLLEELRERGEYLKSEAVAAGAEMAGCSPLTTTRYLSKLTSQAGPLSEFSDALGNKLLIWKGGR